MEHESEAVVQAAFAASMSTFSGMHTSEDLSTREAQQLADQQAEEDGEEPDEIVQELPIMLTQALAQTLFLKQVPTRPPHLGPDDNMGPLLSCKVKPIQKKIEMEYGLLNAGINYQPENGRLGDDAASGHNYDHGHQYDVKKVTLAAKPVPPKTNYCVGVLSNGVLHLTPLNAVCRFRPSLAYIDAHDAAAAADGEAKREAHRFERLREGRMTEEEEMEMEEEQYQKVKEEENKKELQTVIMKVKKKEYTGGATGLGSAATGGAAGGIPAGGVMRKQSYAFLKQIEEREDWIPLKMHGPESSATNAQYHKLLSPSTGAPMPAVAFNVAAQHYLSYVNPPDLLEGNSSTMALIATGDPLYHTLEQQALKLLHNAGRIRLDELCHKLLIVNEEQLELVMRELASIAWVVQGCFVLKSSIKYDRNWRSGMAVPSSTTAPASSATSNRARGIADRTQLARDLLICWYRRMVVVNIDEFNAIAQLPYESLLELFNEVATVNTIANAETQAQGIPKGGQWRWKLEPDTKLQQYFPKLVAHSDQQLPHVEAELTRLLQTNSPHPACETATRGLLLTNTEHIVHGLVPAGLTANRGTPESYRPNAPQPPVPQARAAPAAVAPAAAAAAASSSYSLLPATGSPLAMSSQLSATAGIAAFRAHLLKCFETHGIMRNEFLQLQMKDALGGACTAEELSTVVVELASPFGPSSTYWMKRDPASPARSAIAALFATEKVTAAAVRAAAKTLSDEKRREAVKEFAVYQATGQIWQLKSGQP